MPVLTFEAPFIRIEAGNRQTGRGPVVRELPLTVVLNGRELLTTLCSPASLDCLVAGLLFSEGFISRPEDIQGLHIDEEKGTAEVTIQSKTIRAGPPLKPLVASGGGKGASGFDLAVSSAPIDSGLNITPAQVLALMGAFLKSSAVYAATHGVHSAALCQPGGILIFYEDIGRHNAIDKVFGAALLQDLPTRDAVIITSGRISSEILLKVAKRGVPVLISKASPTDLGVALANKLNITLIRASPGGALNIYSGGGRVVGN